MKTIIKYIAIAASSVALYGCQDDHNDINPAARPTASDIDVEFTMLDSNKVVFNLLNPQCNPIWYFDDGTQSTVNGVTKQFLMAGDYSVEIKMYNSNGICDGSIVKQLSFDKTYASFDNETKILTGDSEASWQIARNETGHLGCGSSAENPTEWWCGTPNTKDGTGLYDDKFTFKSDGTYIYNPGEDGLTYINIGTSVFGKGTGTDDYDIPVGEITGTWKFEYRGTQLYLVLSSHTILGYLAADSQWEAPEFIVKQVSGKKITLVWSSNEISWQYILEPFGTQPAQPQDKPVWEYNQEGDLTAGATFATTTFYAHGEGWAGLSTNVLTDKGNGVWTYSLPDATDLQWQAQLAYISQIAVSADKKYDYHVKLLSTTDVSNVTIKVTDTKSDQIILVLANVDLEAGVEYEFTSNDITDIEIPVDTKTGEDGSTTTGAVKFVFDFGGNPANTVITLSEMVLQEAK
ncbi:MAG: hypothetical protein IKS00_03275 [Bacteroidales bacterium]|nr:hypothetical protein [Bacteroidales bacterium]